MARQTLTDRSLKALKPAPAGKRVEIFDAIIPSMGIRVTDKGQKTFFLLGRFPPSKNPTRRALGEYPVLSLEEARNRAREWLDLVGKGIDPKAQQEAESKSRAVAAARKKERSFEAVLQRYLQARRRDGIRKVDEDERDFFRECLPTLYQKNQGNKDIQPVWEGRPVDDITMDDILMVVEGIAKRGKQRQALNVAQKIGTFFNWCADDELIPSSPYRPKRVNIAIGQRQSRERTLTDDEIRAFWRATDGLGVVYRDLYRLLLLTGQRLNDIAKASWSEVAEDFSTLTVPKDRFKSDRDHVIPLTPEAVEILKGIQRWKNSHWVFSLNGKNSATIGDKVKSRLDELMQDELRKIAGDEKVKLAHWVNHDLRRTVRTRLSELDVLDEVAEAVIGHVPSKLNRTYNHSQRLGVKRDALIRWEGALCGIVKGHRPENIVPLLPKREAI